MDRLRTLLIFMLIALLLAAAIVGFPATGGEATTSEAATPAAVTSEVFAENEPAAVENPVLALGVVAVEPGAAIAPHVHPGTQIAVVARGRLTYSVLTGEVHVRLAGSRPDAESESIIAGETVVLGVGDTVIEQPGSVHHARNEGDEPVVIWVSTLFPAGAPRANYVEATPDP